MATTPKQAINKQITATAADTSYTAPTGTRPRIVAVTVTNTEAATPYTFNAYLIPSGDSAAAANKAINTHTVVELESYPCYELVGHIMDPGDILQFDASTTLKLNVVVSVVELT